jgi:hypothetical protein
MIEFGEWYWSRLYFILLFPDEESAAKAAKTEIYRGDTSTIISHDTATSMANFWSYCVTANKNSVSIIEKYQPFLILDTENKIQRKVLYKDKVGWINLYEWAHHIRPLPCFETI